MRKKVIVMLAEGFEELEAVTVIDILRRAGIKVIAAGLTSKRIKGSRDTVITADKILGQSDLKTDYDACVLPGGMPGAEHLANSDIVKELIKKMHKQKRIIAAICASPALVLSQMGILDNRSATCYPGMEGIFPKSASYSEDPVVIDGNIITSKGPATAIYFALLIVQALIGKKIAEQVRKSVLA